MLLAALLLGLDFFRLGLVAQWRRLMLDLSGGLGFSDPECTTGYCDYMMFWLVGFLVRHGQGGILYDYGRYLAAAAKILPYRLGYWPYIYPPTVLFPAVAISLLPLVPGYYAFCIVSSGVAAFLLRSAGVAWWCILLGAMSPCAMWNLYLGQFGFLCGALLVAGLAAADRRPWQAGGFCALLCIKPQYALLVPVSVLAGRRWLMMCVGILVFTLVILLSLGCGGWAGWRDYFWLGRPATARLLEAPFGPGYQFGGISVFWMLRSFRASLDTAYLGQGVASTLCGLLCWQLWRRPAVAETRRVASTVFLTFLSTPYAFTDDLAIYAVLLMTLVRRQAAWRNAALAWLSVAPAFLPWFVARAGFLPAPLLLSGAVALAWPWAEEAGVRGQGAPSAFRGKSSGLTLS